MGHIGHLLHHGINSQKENPLPYRWGTSSIYGQKRGDTVKCPHAKVEIMKKVKDKKGDFVRF